MWDIVESNIRVIRVPKEEEKENGAEAIFEEVMMEDFLKLIKDAVKKKSLTPFWATFKPCPSLSPSHPTYGQANKPACMLPLTGRKSNPHKPWYIITLTSFPPSFHNKS